MRWWTVFIALGVVLSACTPGTQGVAESTTTSTATTTTGTPSSEICLAGDLPFGDSGLIAALGSDEGDASSIAELRWSASASCERVAVNFGAQSGAPAATLGPTGVSVISYAGIVRVVLPAEVGGSAVADSLFEGALIHATYVVRNEDSIAIDIHAVDGVPIVARAFTTTSPASLVVDIARAETDAAPVGVTTSGTVTIVSPASGSGEYPIEVEGYVAPGIRSIHIQLVKDGERVADTSLALDGDLDTWQHFESAIEDGPVGAAVVFVGTVDTNGEPAEGARVSVTME